mmetsp:Transcript_29881/g.64422  ORF Transcript_29881/g.64422 Transcript_29881/m.64422 type:complete len:90 (+) Transcript_29881:762-1031(+)
MLKLNPAKTVKLVLVRICHQTEGINEAKGHLGANLLREICVQGRLGALGDRGGSKCSGRADEREDSKLHHGINWVRVLYKYEFEGQEKL